MFFYLLVSLFISGCKKSTSQQTLQDFNEVLKIVQKYEYGESRSWLQHYYDVLVKIYNDPSIQTNAENMMLNVLNSGASHASKLLICKSLGTLGTEAALPTLEMLLLDPETSNMALIAMVPLNLEHVDEILIDALSKMNGEHLIGIMNALAMRKTISAIDSIAPYMHNEDEDISNSAINALGLIGGEKATQSLYEGFQIEQESVLAEALINSLESGFSNDDQMIFQSIYDAQPSIALKTAAFQGLLKHVPIDKQVKYLLEALKSSDPEFQASLISTIRQLPHETSLNEIIDAIPGFEPPFQQNLMLAIADRKDTGVRSFAIQMLSSSSSDQRVAALKALKNVSTHQEISLLAGIAARSSGKVEELARDCIYWMDSPVTDEKIIEGAKRSSDLLKSELIKAMGYRKINSSIDFVIDEINNQNSQVRLSAIETAGMIGSKDHLRKVINATKIGSNATIESDAIIAALTRISLNSNDPDFCIEEVYQSIKPTSIGSSLIILISTLGNIQTDASLKYLKSFLKYNDPEIQFACLKAFAGWSDDTPLPLLEDYLQISDYNRNRQQALVGIVNLVQRSKNLSGDGKSERLIASFKSTQTTQEKVIVLNGISRIYSMKAMDFVINQLEDPVISETSREAFIRIADNLRHNYTEVIIQKIDSITESTTDDGFKNRLDILKRSVEL